jgi:hypothetical protein
VAGIQSGIGLTFWYASIAWNAVRLHQKSVKKVLLVVVQLKNCIVAALVGPRPPHGLGISRGMFFICFTSLFWQRFGTPVGIDHLVVYGHSKPGMLLHSSSLCLSLDLISLFRNILRKVLLWYANGGATSSVPRLAHRLRPRVEAEALWPYHMG